MGAHYLGFINNFADRQGYSSQESDMQYFTSGLRGEKRKLERSLHKQPQ
jgi:hypothetical protein